MIDTFQRVFLAFTLTPEFRHNLTDVFEQLPDELLSACRLTKIENLHLTLHFFGAVKAESLLELDAILKIIFKRHHQFDLNFNEIKLFPPHHPRVLALTTTLCEPLSVLTRELKTALKDLGYKTDTRPFVPHITLARLKKAVNFNRLELSDNILTCEHIELINSTLTAHGPNYQSLRRYSLKLANKFTD